MRAYWMIKMDWTEFRPKDTRKKRGTLTFDKQVQTLYNIIEEYHNLGFGINTHQLLDEFSGLTGLGPSTYERLRPVLLEKHPDVIYDKPKKLYKLRKTDKNQEKKISLKLRRDGLE